MIFINKNKTPEFITSFIRNNKHGNYDSESFKPYYQELRNSLIAEQKGLCAYCCTKITLDKSHNEHIEPRHKKDGTYSKRSLDYTNIVASCERESTCGRKKGNEYDELKFISPLMEGCEEIFSYFPDGYMDGDEYTISLLNLNSYELRRARRAMYKILLDMDSDTIEMVYCKDNNNYISYINVIRWFLRNMF